MNIKPLQDRIVVKCSPVVTKTSGGLLLPDNAQDKPSDGVVLAVGPGIWTKGKRIPVKVKIGTHVLFNKSTGIEFKIDGEDILILNESDLLGVK